MAPVLFLDGEMERKETNGAESERNNNSSEKGEDRLGGEKRAASPAQPETPTKKPKIWSIADTVASSSSTAPDPPTSTEESNTSKKQPETSQSGPFHFTFNPWQQQLQMNTLAANMRPPFHCSPAGFAPAAFSPLISPSGLGSPVSAFAHFRPEMFGVAGRSGFSLPPHPALLAAAGLQGNPMAGFMHAGRRSVSFVLSRGNLRVLIRSVD